MWIPGNLLMINKITSYSRKENPGNDWIQEATGPLRMHTYLSWKLEDWDPWNLVDGFLCELLFLKECNSEILTSFNECTYGSLKRKFKRKNLKNRQGKSEVNIDFCKNTKHQESSCRRFELGKSHFSFHSNNAIQNPRISHKKQC